MTYLPPPIEKQAVFVMSCLYPEARMEPDWTLYDLHQRKTKPLTCSRWLIPAWQYSLHYWEVTFKSWTPASSLFIYMSIYSLFTYNTSVNINTNFHLQFERGSECRLNP